MSNQKPRRPLLSWRACNAGRRTQRCRAAAGCALRAPKRRPARRCAPNAASPLPCRAAGAGPKPARTAASQSGTAGRGRAGNTLAIRPRAHQRRQSGKKPRRRAAGRRKRPRRGTGGAAGRPGQGERPAGKEGTAAPELRKVRAAVWEVMAGAAISVLWPDAGGVPVLPAGQPVKDQLCAGDGAGGLLCRGV